MSLGFEIPAMSSMVGATSIRSAISSVVVPGLIPGPLIRKGILMSVS